MTEQGNATRLPSWLACGALIAAALWVGSPLLDAPLFFEDHSLLSAWTSPSTEMLDDRLPGDDELLQLPVARRPLTYLSHRVDAAVASPESLARVAHVHSWLLHCVAIVCAFLVTRRLLPDSSPFTAVMVAAFFALHPVQTEAAGYVSARHHVLANAAGLASMLAFVALLREFRATRAVAAVALGLAAFLASEMALALVPLYLWLFLQSKERSDGSGRVCATVVGAGIAWSVALLLPALAASSARGSEWGQTSATALATFLEGARTGALHLLWPTELSLDYSFAALPVAEAGATPPAAIAALLVAVAACVIAAFLAARGSVRVGGLIVLPALCALPAFLLPVAQTDAALSLAVWPFALLIAVALHPVVRSYPAIFAIVTAGVMVWFATLSQDRLSTWRDPFSRWEQSVAAAPDCAAAQVRFAHEALLKPRPTEALRAFRAACEIYERAPRAKQPQRHLYEHALLQRARILIGSESPADWERARRLFVDYGTRYGPSEAVSDEVVAFLERADVLFEVFRNSEQMGDRSGAIAAAEKLRAAQGDTPFRFEALLYLASVRHESARASASSGAESTEVSENPNADSTEVSDEWALLEEAATAATSPQQRGRLHYRRGLHRLKDKDWAAARLEFEESARELLEGDGKWVTARYLAAECWVHEGKPKEAAAALRQLHLDAPSHLPTLQSLADLQVTLGDFDEAERNYKRVLERAPDSEKARAGLEQLDSRRRAAADGDREGPDHQLRKYLQAGEEMLAKQSYPRAVEAFRQARDIAAELTAPEAETLRCDAYHSYARALARALEWEAASVAYEEYLAFAPTTRSADAAIEAADVLRRRSLLREASHLLEREWVRGVHDPRLQLNLGALAVQLRDAPGAVHWYTAALANDAVTEELLPPAERSRIEGIVEKLKPLLPKVEPQPEDPNSDREDPSSDREDDAD